MCHKKSKTKNYQRNLLTALQMLATKIAIIPKYKKNQKSHFVQNFYSETRLRSRTRRRDQGELQPWPPHLHVHVQVADPWKADHARVRSRAADGLIDFSFIS